MNRLEQAGTWKTIAVGAVLLTSVAARADSPGNITMGDLARTPPVCMDVQGIEATGWSQGYRESPRSGYWKSVMGDTFWAMHHYCWAIVRLNRMDGRIMTANQRTHAYDAAVSDFQYVLNHAKSDFILLPEIYWRMGDAQFKKGDLVAALGYFTRSREAKADYWPAFAGLADIMIRAGKREDALALLREGLEKAPGTPALQERLDRLLAEEARARPAGSKAPRAASASAPGK